MIPSTGESSKTVTSPHLEKVLNIEEYTKPTYQNNDNVYSTQIGSMIFSFTRHSIKNVYDPKAPPPVYMTYALLTSNQRPTDKSTLLAGTEITGSGELKCTDKEVLARTKGVITELIGKVMKNIVQFKRVTDIRLSVKIIEPRSLVDRMTDMWSFAPLFLVQAATEDSGPIARMKKVMAFSIAGLYLSVSQLKPFNPILGETYQGFFPGTDVAIYCEKIKHSPVTIRYLMVHPAFRFYGRYEFNVQMHKNSMSMFSDGIATVDFGKGEKIMFNTPTLKLGGLIMGDRVARWSGAIKYVDEKNGLKGIIKLSAGEKKGFFGGKKKLDSLKGHIYQYKPSGKEVFSISTTRKEVKKVDMKMEDMMLTLAEISGSYLDKLTIGNEDVWNINVHKPLWAKPVPVALPSDSRFREDLTWMKHGNNVYSEEWKSKQEDVLDKEEALRNKTTKK